LKSCCVIQDHYDDERDKIVLHKTIPDVQDQDRIFWSQTTSLQNTMLHWDCPLVASVLDICWLVTHQFHNTLQWQRWLTCNRHHLLVDNSWQWCSTCTVERAAF